MRAHAARKPSADALVEATRKKNACEVTFLPPWRVRVLLERFPKAVSLTGVVLRDPKENKLLAGPNRSVEGELRRSLRWAAWLAPTYPLATPKVGTSIFAEALRGRACRGIVWYPRGTLGP